MAGVGLRTPAIPASIALPSREQLPSEAGVDPVDCTIFELPKAGARGSILVQIFAHKPDQDQEVIRLAHEADETARRLGFRSLEVEIPRGARLQIELTLPGIEIEGPGQQTTAMDSSMPNPPRIRLPEEGIVRRFLPRGGGVVLRNRVNSPRSTS